MSRETDLPCFKAYDIRGKVPLELNLELVRQIGLAFVAEFNLRRVCIGYDMRLSSKDFSLVLANGLMDGGADVLDIGMCGTEELYHAVFSQDCDGGVMITASHNPADWNGMKLVRAGAAPVSQDSGLVAIKNRILAGDLPIARRAGHRKKQSFKDDYVDCLLSLMGNAPEHDLAPLTIVANAGNGCAWPVLEKLQKHLPCKLIPVFPEPDGTFPNGVPNPLLPENRAATAEAVKKHKADLGLAWDGDFDRCFFFDEKGNFIEGYYIVGLLAEALLRGHPGEKIIHDPRLTWNTVDIVKNAGGIPIETKSGHAFMKERLRAEKALYGGEMSAHHYFREFSYCDSGMLVWLLVYKLLSEVKKPFSELVEERMRLFPASGEINREVADPRRVMEEVKAHYAAEALAVYDIDGLGMEFADWRFNLRMSNTEPLLRLNVESRGDESLMRERTKNILGFMK